MQSPQKRYFNTSGPNIRSQHYTLEREALILQGLDLVHRERYFTIWAPRQTGKSTYFRMLAERLKEEGYKVCHVNFESYRNQSQADFLKHLSTVLSENWEDDFSGHSLATIFQKIEAVRTEKSILIIDEVEGINPAYFNDFLHAIRGLYHSRELHCLKSVILVGVSNITGVIQDNASPFNIADNLEVDYFTQAEVSTLLEMHEKATNQLFDTEVKQKIYQITAGQPGLVNGFAHQLVTNYADASPISYEAYLHIEKNYISILPDKNIFNIINKGKKHRAFVERLLFNDEKIAFQIYDEQIRELSANGLISNDADNNIIFKVPLYKKCLYYAFFPHYNGERKHIEGNIDLDDYFDAEGRLQLDHIIKAYQEYAQRRGFRYFIEKDENGAVKGLKEAALVYSFETFIQAYLQVMKGKSYLEAHVALGRSDLIINVRGQEFVLECKVYRNITQFKEGKQQLAYYVKSLGLLEGTYLVFVSSEINHKKVVPAIEQIEGITVKTYLVSYDLATDFGTS